MLPLLLEKLLIVVCSYDSLFVECVTGLQYTKVQNFINALFQLNSSFQQDLTLRY